MSGWQGAQALHADHGAAVAYRGMVDCFVRTVKEEGVQVRSMRSMARSMGHCMGRRALPLPNCARLLIWWMLGRRELFAAFCREAGWTHAERAACRVRLAGAATESAGQGRPAKLCRGQLLSLPGCPGDASGTPLPHSCMLWPHTPPPPRIAQALFKGLGPNYLKVVPSIAIAFATYEEVRPP